MEQEDEEEIKNKPTLKTKIINYTEAKIKIINNI